VGETERLPPSAYQPEVTAEVYASLARKAEQAIAAGHSAIVDAVFAAADERHAIESVAASRRIPFRGIFLVADRATRVRRVGGRVADASDADAAVARRQESYDLGRMGWTQVDASGTPEQTLVRAKATLP
jgi:predicted kinase